MIVRTAKGFHALIAASLFGCALCPLIEIALHSNGAIFQRGYDTESTLALLLLLLELSFAIGRLLVALLPCVLERLNLVCFYSDRHSLLATNFGIVLPEISPPLFLRI